MEYLVKRHDECLFFVIKFLNNGKLYNKGGWIMKKNNKRVLRFILFVLVIGSILSGCKAKEDITKEDKGDDKEDEISMNVGGKDYDIITRSENVSNLVVDVNGVDNASSIIFNDMVVVALEMPKDSVLTDDMKETIINLVLESDNAIRQVLVTDNKKTFDQVETIVQSLMNGEPYDDHVNEINRIIEKLKKE